MYWNDCKNCLFNALLNNALLNKLINKKYHFSLTHMTLFYIHNSVLNKFCLTKFVSKCLNVSTVFTMSEFGHFFPFTPTWYISLWYPLYREQWMSEQVRHFRYSQCFICSVKLSKAKPPSGLISFSLSNHLAH